MKIKNLCRSNKNLIDCLEKKKEKKILSHCKLA